MTVRIARDPKRHETLRWVVEEFNGGSWLPLTFNILDYHVVAAFVDLAGAKRLIKAMRDGGSPHNRLRASEYVRCECDGCIL